jgi:transposase
MPRAVGLRLVPDAFTLEGISSSPGKITLSVRSGATASACPDCRARSRRIHSGYQRRVADLPLAGQCVELMLTVRRFRCPAVLCRRQIFAERFAPDVLAPSARRTSRLAALVHHLGLALGGRPAASLARRLGLPVSNDTLLRVIRRRTRPVRAEPAIIGIDDFAFRRNYRYGTLICDLEHRRTLNLLPDREPATARAWLRDHPTIQVIARDRGGGYGEAAASALPHAVQVADRWHLMENASRAFLDAVRRSMRQIREVVGTATINPDLLTAAERIQYEGYLRREEANAAIHALAKAGLPIKQICRRTGHSRRLVRAIVRGERTDVFRVRQNSLEPHLPWLDAQWNAGTRNATALWRRLTAQGFRGSLRVISEWATRRRRAEQASVEALQRVPSARTVARLITTGRDRLTRAETVTVAAIEEGVPALVEAREVVMTFQAMVRSMTPAKLKAWIERASMSLITSFARGVAKDEVAVRAALTLPWSNGQTEGQITKLKLVKRQMYGRGKIDLLEARLIGAL